MLCTFVGPALHAISRVRRGGVTVNGQEELGTAMIGGLDNLLQVCAVCRSGVHSGVMDGMAELLQFGDEGFHHVAVDLALTEAFVFGSVAGTASGVPCVYAYSNSSHLLSGGMGSKYKRTSILWHGSVYFFIP